VEIRLHKSESLSMKPHRVAHCWCPWRTVATGQDRVNGAGMAIARVPPRSA